MPANRTELLQQLSVKLDMVSTRYTELKARQQLFDALKEENALLKQQLDSIKMAKTLVLSEKDVKKARQQLNQLIKQIDHCIALLTVEESQ